MNDISLTELLYRRTEVQSNVFASALIPNFDVIDEVSPDRPSVDSILVACLKPVPPGEMDRQRIMVHSCLGDVHSIRPVSKPLLSNGLSPDTEVVAIKAESCSINGEESFLMLALAFVKRKVEAGICIHRLPSTDMIELTRHQGKVILPIETATVMPLHSLPWQIISVKFSEHGELKLAILVSHVYSKTSGGDRRPLSIFALRRNGDFLSISNYEHFFPEFHNCEEQIFYMDSVYLEERMQRLTAWGTDTGSFEVACVNLSYENELIHRFSFNHSTPITSLRFFPEFVLPRMHSPGNELAALAAEAHNFTPVFHLLVSSAAEPTVVYTNPLKDGISLSNQIVLSESSDFDCVLCTCLIDLDLDGTEEIVLGTYSGNLLAYKRENSQSMQYKMVSRQKVGGPVLAIHVGDMTGDGLKEMAVVTTRGVHIMQYPLHSVMARLESIVDQGKMKPIDS